MKLSTFAAVVSLSLSFIPACVAVTYAESLAAKSSMQRLLEAWTHTHKHGLTQSQKNTLYMPEKSALDEMEISLVSMAKERVKQGDSAANLTDFLEQIQEIIDQTMKKSIKARYNASQHLLDTTWDNYTEGCKRPDDATWSPYTSLNDQHVACRAAEQSIYGSYKDCVTDEALIEAARNARCSKYESLNTMSRYSPSPCLMPYGTAAPTIGNYLTYMRKHWQAEAAQLSEAKSECHNVTTTLSPAVECNSRYCEWLAKQYECDNFQRQFENGACQLARQYTCAKFTTCWHAKADAYNAAHDSANASQPGLHTEWKAVERIQCLIAALGGSTDQLETKINECIDKKHSAEAVTFILHGPTASAPACVQAHHADMTPGNAAFAMRWYAHVNLSVAGVEDERTVGAPMSCASSTCDCWNGTAPVCSKASNTQGAGSASTTEASTTAGSGGPGGDMSFDSLA